MRERVCVLLWFSQLGLWAVVRVSKGETVDRCS
jgi:hypothetical protein